jgi:zona occludens toxin (predicted ATPase)
MKNNSGKTVLWVVVALILVVGLYFLLKNKPAVVAPVDETTTTETQSVQDTSGPSPVVSPAPISYANALIKYADRRIQLDTLCQAHPISVTYKDNTGIMIDNRSSKTRTVKVGTTFTIKPYGFKIVVLPDVYLSTKTLLVDCDSMQNVATILVQE